MKFSEYNKNITLQIPVLQPVKTSSLISQEFITLNF